MITRPEFPDLLFFKNLSAESTILHFSTTRNGGVSTGKFSSLNLGNYSDDSPLNIFENRTRVARKFHMTADQMITPHQTHGNKVVLIDNQFLELSNSSKIDALYGYDASITGEKGIFLCVTTADCVPILLYDRKNGAVGAIHAGWRSTSGKIVENTIDAMMHNFGTSPEDILAAIGPGIGIDNYEVGDEVVEELIKNGFNLNEPLLSRNPKTGKAHIDLKEINRQTLIGLGVSEEKIEKTSFCTYSNKQLFFSARRQSIRSGRMLSGIMIR